MRVWQSKTPAYISHTFFLRRPRGFNTTGPFLMCDLFWNLLSKQPYILQLLHFNSLSRRREHQTSTGLSGACGRGGRHWASPALWCALPHPLQNRVPRVQVLLPLPKKSGIAFAVPGFFVSERKDLAARFARRPACGACRGGLQPVGCVQARPRRQPRQVLLPLPKSRRKHWVFAGFLFACVAWLCGSLWFKLWLFPSGFTRSQPFSSPLAPKTHPVSPFSGFSGCVFLFFAVFRPQNFCPGFCASCRIASTS